MSPQELEDRARTLGPLLCAALRGNTNAAKRYMHFFSDQINDEHSHKLAAKLCKEHFGKLETIVSRVVKKVTPVDGHNTNSKDAKVSKRTTMSGQTNVDIVRDKDKQIPLDMNKLVQKLRELPTRWMFINYPNRYIMNEAELAETVLRHMIAPAVIAINTLLKAKPAKIIGVGIRAQFFSRSGRKGVQYFDHVLVVPGTRGHLKRLAIQRKGYLLLKDLYEAIDLIIERKVAQKVEDLVSIKTWLPQVTRYCITLEPKDLCKQSMAVDGKAFIPMKWTGPLKRDDKTGTPRGGQYKIDTWTTESDEGGGEGVALSSATLSLGYLISQGLAVDQVTRGCPAINILA
ncbi:hypothetical protein EXIGLDRAFT_783618 [Exidia glandulosa HHB12029]|uniref:Uncharacterized protein n=1 Tax=Exidia glandulosa HHB12029 TaxID=1314781 RepID=A0A166MYR4_EXIGL|nr:hypothetical protein EXIGLDRAFT_783618 [Exidia glandulosa HHB12029]